MQKIKHKLPPPPTKTLGEGSPQVYLTKSSHSHVNYIELKTIILCNRNNTQRKNYCDKIQVKKVNCLVSLIISLYYCKNKEENAVS